MKQIKDGWYDEDEYQYLTTIDDVIADVRENGTKSWIWENGEIRADIFTCNIFPILEELKSNEIQLDKESFDDIYENGEGGNTYNWSANISNDLDYRWKDGVGCIMKVHLSGDIRGNYTNWFAIDSLESLFYADYISQSKVVNERYSADMDAMSETYDIYDYETGESYSGCWAFELKDVLEWIDKNVDKDQIGDSARRVKDSDDDEEADDEYEFFVAVVGSESMSNEEAERYEDELSELLSYKRFHDNNRYCELDWVEPMDRVGEGDSVAVWGFCYADSEDTVYDALEKWTADLGYKVRFGVQDAIH